MTKTVFTDTTKYPFVALLGLSIALLLFPVLMYYYAADKVFIYILGIVEIILLIGAYYMYMMKFTFELSPKGLRYILYGFSKKENFIAWKEITALNIIALDYTTKFGGWGNRKNKNGEAFVFNDGMFLEVETENKKYYFSISDKGKNDCVNYVANLQTRLKK